MIGEGGLGIRRFGTLSALLGPVAVLLFVSCYHPTAFRSEDFSVFYPKTSESHEEYKVDQKYVVTWELDPKLKRRVGVLEEWRVKPRGTHKSRTQYRLYEARGVHMVGFATEDGIFFRLKSDGYTERLGEWQVLMTGLKMFYHVPLRHSLDLEVIDPYD